MSEQDDSYVMPHVEGMTPGEVEEQERIARENGTPFGESPQEEYERGLRDLEGAENGLLRQILPEAGSKEVPPEGGYTYVMPSGEELTKEEFALLAGEPLFDRIARGLTTTADGQPITRDLLLEDIALRKNIGDFDTTDFRDIENLLKEGLSNAWKADYCKNVLGVEDIREALGENSELDPEEYLKIKVTMATHVVMNQEYPDPSKTTDTPPSERSIIEPLLERTIVPPPSEEMLVHISEGLKGFSPAEIDGFAIYATAGPGAVESALGSMSMNYELNNEPGTKFMRILRGEVSAENPISREELLRDLSSPRHLEMLEAQLKATLPEGAFQEELLGKDGKLDPEDVLRMFTKIPEAFPNNEAFAPTPELLEQYSEGLKGFSPEEINGLASFRQFMVPIEKLEKEMMERFKDPEFRKQFEAPGNNPELRIDGKDLGNGVYDTDPSAPESDIVPNPDPGMQMDIDSFDGPEGRVLNVRLDVQPASPAFNTSAGMPDTILACAAEGVGAPVSEAPAGAETTATEEIAFKGFTA